MTTTKTTGYYDRLAARLAARDPQPEREPERCEAEHPITDFDGSSTTMPCGALADYRVELNDAQGAAYVEQMLTQMGKLGATRTPPLSAWEEYRAQCLAGMDGEPHDPGTDPGSGNYGRGTMLLCAGHHAELKVQDEQDDSLTILRAQPLDASIRNNPNGVGLRYDDSGKPVGLDWNQVETGYARALGQ